MPACLRLVHRAVDLQLRRRPHAVDGHRARDVGGVELVGLDAHVGQQQRPRRDDAVVAPPVQRRRVPARADDRGVADVVALEPGASPERPLQPALAADVACGRRRSAVRARRRRSRGSSRRRRPAAGPAPTRPSPGAARPARGRARRRARPAAACRGPRRRPRSRTVCVVAVPLAAPASRSASGRVRRSSMSAVSSTDGTLPTQTAPCMRLVKYSTSPGWAYSRTNSVARVRCRPARTRGRRPRRSHRSAT